MYETWILYIIYLQSCMQLLLYQMGIEIAKRYYLRPRSEDFFGEIRIKEAILASFFKILCLHIISPSREADIILIFLNLVNIHRHMFYL